MVGQLAGRRIAFLVANEGVEQDELTQPWAAVESAGGRPLLIAPEPGSVRSYHHLDKGAAFPVHQTVDESTVDDFDGLVLPGGVANADLLRTRAGAVAFAHAFVDADKPVAVICHGAWTLIETGALKGRTLTSSPSLRTDLINAGAEWVDEQVHVDTTGSWTLVSSRNAHDLPAFCREAVRAFAG